MNYIQKIELRIKELDIEELELQKLRRFLDHKRKMRREQWQREYIFRGISIFDPRSIT